MGWEMEEEMRGVGCGIKGARWDRTGRIHWMEGWREEGRAWNKRIFISYSGMEGRLDWHTRLSDTLIRPGHGRCGTRRNVYRKDGMG
jgi:hypothetical protein